ncbi:hypothetical protein GCM10009555_028670 [Acrocarpospora macrocephala]|uniref:Uncharacterized protein n=1 Tax=Acrocarpospora macrocephala TaxID=150177 RepID=A0A5M3X3X0_9ACTN|nr:hypothetical protein [Acrocarpospora macrocephala]GES15834.1 hypothetical protein Amac_094320 [Acrocarpospora macrocephala]
MDDPITTEDPGDAELRVRLVLIHALHTEAEKLLGVKAEQSE